jgi:hypothetical protein
LVRLPKLQDRRGLEVTVAITEKDSAKYETAYVH